MRVKGNVSPNLLDTVSYSPVPGQVEVRLRENVKQITVADEMTGKSYPMYEYDEYAFILEDREDLREEIESNMADWLATGRTLEVNPLATLYVTAKIRAIDGYTEELVEGGLL